MSSEHKLAQQRLHAALDYDAETGQFFWKSARNKTSSKSDLKAGCTKNRHGYASIQIDGSSYLAHRLAWFYQFGEWPAGEVDHINQEKLDNRIGNLRIVDRSRNCRNTPLRHNNRSGVVGVNFSKRDGRWLAQIGSGGRNLYLGMSVDFFEAVCMRKSAEIRNGYHRNHGTISRRYLDKQP